MEDDIYYVPGKKALAIREVENLTGHDIGTEQPVDPTVLAGEISRSAGSSTPPATFSSSNNTKINARSGQLEQVNIQSLTREAEEKLANNEEIDMTLYENTGYWIGGYRGPASDLAEIQRIINMYPEGFANFSNGQEIALNLSFDSDWNVYTDNGRYWWFPSNTNINLYSSLLFGTYPKYIWTIVWNNPRFDSWAFDATFNNRFNWSLNLGWGGPGWSIGFGWNSGWYDPWYGGWYDPWYRPWYGGYYPGWGYPHWHHPHWGHPGWDYPHWGGGSGHYPNRPNRPHWAGQRPGFGGGEVRYARAPATLYGQEQEQPPVRAVQPERLTVRAQHAPILPVSTGRQVRHVRIRQLPVQERSPGRIQARIYAGEPIRPVPHKGEHVR